MKHYQRITSVSNTGTNHLLEQVFSILDSKIQFIDFQVQRYFDAHTTAMANLPESLITTKDTTNASCLVNNLDQILTFTASLQNDLKLLQILKAWLKEETASEILRLITDNHYLSFEEEQLEEVLKQRVLLHYKMELA